MDAQGFHCDQYQSQLLASLDEATDALTG